MSHEDIVNATVGIIGLMLTSLAIISKEFRVYAIMAAVLLVFAVVILRNYTEIGKLIIIENKVRESLNIHRQLIDIKAELQCMKRGRK